MMEKNRNEYGIIPVAIGVECYVSGFFGLPGLATWAARPGPISPGPIARLAANAMDGRKDV